MLSIKLTIRLCVRTLKYVIIYELVIIAAPPELPINDLCRGYPYVHSY